MKPLSLITGFLPLIAFSVIARRLAENGVAWSALIAVAITLISLAVTKPVWPPKILNVGSGVLFAAIAVTGFVGGSGVDDWLYRWAVPGVGLVLGLFVLATVPVMPFTEQYARESTPRAYWGSPTFIKINRVLSLGWGATITVLGACSLLVAGLERQPVGTGDPYLLELALNWIVPIAVCWFMVKFTMSYPDKVSGAHPSAGPVASTAPRTSV